MLDENEAIEQINLKKELEILKKQQTNSGMEMWRKYVKIGKILNRIDLLKKKSLKMETMETMEYFFKYLEEH